MGAVKAILVDHRLVVATLGGSAMSFPRVGQSVASFQVLGQVALVLEEFAAGFSGKASPVHHFWHSLDIAHTRFSGRHIDQLSDVDSAYRAGARRAGGDAAGLARPGGVTDPRRPLPHESARAGSGRIAFRASGAGPVLITDSLGGHEFI
ncbi:DUF5996 family protein [Streptomyces sp. NBC_00435]|uniref:DUF5996 family protein n=1 Tax=Streptomyces sp. NBC_00435 TaxID=2903649 RepID=UPI002E200A5D